MGLSLAIAPRASADVTHAGELARQLGLRLLPPGIDPAFELDAGALLQVDGTRLSLQQTGPRAPGPVLVDFAAGSMRHRRRGGHNELLGRGLGVGRKTGLAVIDATAGLGRDSFVLADLGCRVLLCERDPVVAALLASGLARALASDDPWVAGCASRMHLHSGEAADLPPSAVAGSDAIYLDPMFPERNKRAAVKKEMALFQHLLAPGASDDGAALLAWSLAQPVARVVVKRPLRAEPLPASRTPSHALLGRSVRYDVYVLRALAQEHSPRA